MRVITVVIISIALTLSLAPIYLFVFEGSQQQPRQPIAVNLDNYLRKMNDTTYVVIKPPSWVEVYVLAHTGNASYKYITWYSLSDFDNLAFKYQDYISSDPCRYLTSIYENRMDFYGFLLENNCTWLKTFLFGTDRSWYLAYSFIEPLEKKVIERYQGGVYLWALVYNTSYGVVIKFFNILDNSERKALEATLKKLIEDNSVFVLLLTPQLKTWWYDIYKHLERNKKPFASLIEVEASPGQATFEMIYSTRQDLFKALLGSHLVTSYKPIDDPTGSIAAIVYEKGSPVSVSLIDDVFCQFFENLRCGEDTLQLLTHK
jgi:hypothetical protein